MDTQGSATHIVDIFKFGHVSGPRATKWPKENWISILHVCGTTFLGGKDSQKFIWMDTQGSATHIVDIFKFGHVSGPRATKWPKENWISILHVCGTTFLGGKDSQKLIWIDTQGSGGHITQLLKFTNQSGPRPHFATKNKWPQKHFISISPLFFYPFKPTNSVQTPNICTNPGKICT